MGASEQWEQFKSTMVERENLWSAAKANDTAALLRLLRSGADIDARDHRGFSPLMLAAYAGNAEAFELLIAEGADVESADSAGNSVLMGAAFKGYPAMVERLLSAGADPRAHNQAGLDARGFASMFGRTEIVALLDRLAPAPEPAAP
ncbi:MAG: hypothetical protein NVS2B9_16620 [Myxococcales bacterium]